MKQETIYNSLPHNFLAEKMILQCLVLDNSRIELTIQKLNKEAFYFKNHSYIFQIIRFMSENNLIVDNSTLTSFIQTNGLIKKIGGLQIITELNNTSPNLIYMDEYIKLVNEKFYRRSLIKFAYELIYSSTLTTTLITEILAKAENDLFNIINPLNTQESNIVNSSKLLNQVFIQLKKKCLMTELVGLKSGLRDLDELTQGFQKSDLIILAGRPSTGKTALSLHFTRIILKEANLPVLFFTLEMSREQIMYRLLTLESRLSFRKLKTGELFENDWIKFNQAAKVLSKFPLFINDTTNLSIQEIRSSIRKIYFDNQKLGLVIIDYLQLIQNFKTNDSKLNRVDQLSQITKSLKLLAREFDIPIIALSQLSRNVEKRNNQKPILSDLRDSGSIEQDADLVIMLSQNSQTNRQDFDAVELTIAKHRNGPTGQVGLRFDKKLMRFSPLIN